jgi:hypothetical protein
MTETAGDLPGFAGATLTSVTAWTYGISLGFNDEARSIMLESAAEIRRGAQIEAFTVDGGTALAKALLDLLEKTVTRAHRSAERHLTLTFPDCTVVIMSDESGYENYQVDFPDGSILVG